MRVLKHNLWTITTSMEKKSIPEKRGSMEISDAGTATGLAGGEAEKERGGRVA